MVLVDTSVWVSHLRSGNARLAALLAEGMVVGHPFVVGEIACGALRARDEILGLLTNLPAAQVADADEVLAFIERQRLMGSGVGYIDVHLVASALLSRVLLWTEDRALARVAGRLGIAYA